MLVTAVFVCQVQYCDTESTGPIEQCFLKVVRCLSSGEKIHGNTQQLGRQKMAREQHVAQPAQRSKIPCTASSTTNCFAIMSSEDSSPRLTRQGKAARVREFSPTRSRQPQGHATKDWQEKTSKSAVHRMTTTTMRKQKQEIEHLDAQRSEMQSRWQADADSG